MLSLTLALDLASAGVDWAPRDGDRFAVRRTEMVDEVFHLAGMVIEARRLGSGTIFAFNGTTEWALDSIPQSETVWLPSESQLRALLGARFAGLTRRGEGFEVALTDGSTHVAGDAEDAYALALLAALVPAPDPAQ